MCAYKLFRMGSIFFRMENNCSGSYDYLELFKSFVGVWEIFFSPEWFRIENNCSGNYDYLEIFKAFVGVWEIFFLQNDSE